MDGPTIEARFRIGRFFYLATMAGWLSKLDIRETTFLTYGKEKVELRLWLTFVEIGVLS